MTRKMTTMTKTTMTTTTMTTTTMTTTAPPSHLQGLVGHFDDASSGRIPADEAGRVDEDAPFDSGQRGKLRVTNPAPTFRQRLPVRERPQFLRHALDAPFSRVVGIE